MRKPFQKNSSEGAGKKKVLTSVAFAGGFFLFLAVVFGMFLLTDSKKLGEALLSVRPGEIAVLLGITTLSLFLRIFRWNLLLGASGIKVSARETAAPLLSGLAASLVTPAKTGDLLRCILLEKSTGISAKKTVGSLFVERLFDIVVLLAVSSTFLLAIKKTPVALLFSLVAILAVLIIGAGVLWFPPLSHLVFKRILKGSFQEVPESVARIHKKAEFYLALLLSLAIWSADFGRLYFAINWIFGFSLPFLQAAQVSAISIIAGVASAIPGGIGSTEVSAIALFSLLSIPAYASSGALIFDRLFGFWPVVVAGAILSPQALKKKAGKQ
jgi:uncharacterized membrane protein YbhN (UPF0104 family)